MLWGRNNYFYDYNQYLQEQDRSGLVAEMPIATEHQAVEIAISTSVEKARLSLCV